MRNGKYDVKKKSNEKKHSFNFKKLPTVLSRLIKQYNVKKRANLPDMKVVSETIQYFFQKRGDVFITNLHAIIDPSHCFGAYAIISEKPSIETGGYIRHELWSTLNLLCDVTFEEYGKKPLLYVNKDDEKYIAEYESGFLFKVYLSNIFYEQTMYTGDQYYFGEIPKNVSVYDLSDILAIGLKKYMYIHAFLDKQEVNSFTEDKLIDVLDLWFEHDAHNSNFFDHIIGDGEIENGFLQNTSRKAIDIASY
jgi:hypothetical protein